MRGGFTAQDIRFTAKGDRLYAIILAWPEDGRITVKSLGEGSALSKLKIKTVELAGSKAKLKWNRGAHCIRECRCIPRSYQIESWTQSADYETAASLI